MNPHDMAKRPGAHLVAEEFGVEDPWALSDDHAPRDPLYLVGRTVVEAARGVDELHGELTRAAQSAIELLEPIGRGDHAGMRGWYGILRTTGPQIELLVARRGAAYEQLTRAVSTYRRLLPECDAALGAKVPRQSLSVAPEQAPGRDDDWAIADGRQLAALRQSRGRPALPPERGLWPHLALRRGRQPAEGAGRDRRAAARGRAAGEGHQHVAVSAGAAPVAHTAGRGDAPGLPDDNAACARCPQPQQPRLDSWQCGNRPHARFPRQHAHQALPLPLPLKPQEGRPLMSTAIYTRHLVEHRYGRPLEDLQRDGAHGGSGDPVLPIVLRRLGGLAQTNAHARAARRNLDAAWQRCRSGGHALDDLVLRYAAEVVDLERQEQSEAEAVWDLLDVRLLLDQPAASRPSARRTGPVPGDEDLMAIARQVAARLPRLNREALRQGLRDRGIHVSNRRLGTVLQRLRAERDPH